jgi:hypothetical protein
MVEPRPARVIVPHMPFADESGLITVLLEMLRKGRQSMAGGAPIGIVGDTMLMRIQAGKETGTAG